MADEKVKKAFEELENKFGLDPLITKWILGEDGLGAKSVDDFLYAATKPEELASVAELAGVDTSKKLLMTSRVRQAWVSLKKATEESETLKRKSLDDVAMDEMLPQRELDDMGIKHYARYKMSWPPEVMPSDQIISRVTKEMDKRLLGVVNVWKVKTQSMQQRTVRKRAKLTGDLEVILGEEDEEGPAKDMTHYLAALHCLLIAYSIPGVKAKQSPVEDGRGVDTCLVVECPLDVLMRYFYRVQARAAEFPGHAKHEALQWIVKHDEADRSLWVDKYRNSPLTLGEVIRDTLIQREALWEVPVLVRQTVLERAPQQPRQQPKQSYGSKAAGKSKGKGGKNKSGGQAKVGKAKTMAAKLRDGKALCAEYNLGRCHALNCPKGRHQCSGVQVGGRVCGGPHPAIRCPNRQVPKVTDRG